MGLPRFFACCFALLLLVSARAQDNAASSNSEIFTDDIVVALDGSSVETIHSEKRTVDDAGALAASRTGLPYNAGMQQLEIVEAHTLKKDGTKVPVDPASVYEQLSKDAGQFTTYADLRTKIIHFPQFAAGDTAVFTARLKTPEPYFKGHYLHGIAFPRSRAFADVRETITVPRGMALKVEHHDVEFSRREQGGTIVYSFRHVQKEPEPSRTVIVSAIDREPRFFVSTFKDYAELGRAYAASSQPRNEVTAKVKALADRITAGETNRREQARKIYEWVSKNIRYVAIELGRGSMIPHDVDFTLANGYGDCKDHDTLLQALLKAKGIAAESILINSGNAYSLTEVPSFVQLNHVITHVPEFDAWLDSSFSMAPFGVLPQGQYGKPAVRVSDARAARFTMPVLPPGLSTVTMSAKSRLDAGGTLTGEAATAATGPASIILRVEGLALQTIGPEKAADLQMGQRGARGTVKITSPTELSPGYTIASAISSPGYSEWLSGKKGRTLPGALTNLGAEPALGPLYLTAGDSEPVPCSSLSAVEDVSLELPPGIVPAQLPDQTRVKTSNVSFTAEWRFSGGTITLHRDYASHFDKAVCDGDVRAETAAALKKINDSYRTPIVLRRAGGAATAALRDEPDDDAPAGMCRSLARSDRFQEAVGACSQALEGEPDGGEELESRGLAYFRLGKYAEALADFDRAFATHPKGARFLYARGLTKRKMGDTGGGKADMQKARQMNPAVASRIPPQMAR